MTIFRDRLGSAIRIKRRFAASGERIKTLRNAVIVAVMLSLLVLLIAIVFAWLET